MSWLRWAYHRVGQVTCFLLSGIGLTTIQETGLPGAILTVGFLFGGVALRALHVWQQIDDPSRE